MASDWNWIQQERIRGWHVMSGQSVHTGRWTGWAKREPLIARNPIVEPGDVYFESGATRKEAIDRLVAKYIIPSQP